MPVMNTLTKSAPGVLSRLGISAKRRVSSFAAGASQITEPLSIQFGGGSTTIHHYRGCAEEMHSLEITQ